MTTDNSTNTDPPRRPQIALFDGYTQAGPFLKWAGGKGQLLKQYEPFFPHSAGNGYYEPFLTSGAVFFHLRPRGLFNSYRLSSSNEDLIACYTAVRDQVDDLLAKLDAHRIKHSRAHYYNVRNLDRDRDWSRAPLLDRAARMLYLNRTCYNGLWRVNSRGEFNVPMGRYANPDILNEDRLRDAARALQGIELVAEPFEAITTVAGPGDFVYFDPPYLPISPTSNFTSFSAEEFGQAQHRKLAEVFAMLDQQGSRLMLSNSDTALVRELYQGFHIETVQARRMINSVKGRRGQISEVLITNQR
jgi:DNA adenine methylase